MSGKKKLKKKKVKRKKVEKINLELMLKISF
jgi:hypothetical protein